MKITVGADPEFFLFDSKVGENISAHELVPGTKDKPHRLKHGAVQLDGTAAEFNIDPASSAEEFRHNIESVLGEIRGMIPKRFTFNFSPSVRFKEDYFNKEIPESSKELGCTPDFSAFSENADPAPRPVAYGAYKTMRTGAGHIHVGWTDVKDPKAQDHYWDCRRVILNMYNNYTNWCSIWDSDNERRYLYGSGPVFRPKTYGCEFRTPSNAWLKYPKIYEYLFNSTVKIVENIADNKETNNSFNYYNLYYNDPIKYKNRITNLNTQAKQKKFPLFPEDWNQEVVSW